MKETPSGLIALTESLIVKKFGRGWQQPPEPLACPRDFCTRKQPPPRSLLWPVPPPCVGLLALTTHECNTAEPGNTSQGNGKPFPNYTTPLAFGNIVSRFRLLPSCPLAEHESTLETRSTRIEPSCAYHAAYLSSQRRVCIRQRKIEIRSWLDHFSQLKRWLQMTLSPQW